MHRITSQPIKLTLCTHRGQADIVVAGAPAPPGPFPHTHTPPPHGTLSYPLPPSSPRAYHSSSPTHPHPPSSHRMTAGGVETFSDVPIRFSRPIRQVRPREPVGPPGSAPRMRRAAHIQAHQPLICGPGRLPLAHMHVPSVPLLFAFSIPLIPPIHQVCHLHFDCPSPM